MFERIYGEDLEKKWESFKNTVIKNSPRNIKNKVKECLEERFKGMES
jgi:hypothetical protein